MSEHYNPQSESHLLEYIDRLVARGAAAATSEAAIAPSPSEAPGDIYGFAARVASTVPQAEEGFRRELLGKLLASFDAEAEGLQLDPPAQATRSETYAPLPTRAPAGRQGPSKHAGPGESKTARRGLLGVLWGGGRAGSYAAAVLSLALMGLVLVGLAFMLGSRQNTGRASNTPVASVTGSATASTGRYTGIAPRQAYEVARVQKMAWSPDGSIMATAYGGTVELWEASSGRFLHSVTAKEVRKLAWSPDSRTLAIDSAGSNVRLIDAATGQERANLHFAEPKGNPTYDGGANLLIIAWSPDSTMLATHFTDIPPFGSGEAGPSVVLGLWDAATGEQVRSISVVPAEGRRGNPQDGRNKLVWSPDGRFLASISIDGLIKVWDAAAGDLKLVMAPDSDHITEWPSGDFDWSPDGKTLAVISGKTTRIATENGTSDDIVVTGRAVELWDVATGKIVRTLPRVLPPLTPRPTEPPLPPGPVPSGMPDYALTPFPTITPLPPTATTPPDIAAQTWGRISELHWSPDGRTLLVVAGDIKLWDPQTGEQKVGLQLDAAAKIINKVAWSPDGSVIATLTGVESHNTGLLPDSERLVTKQGTLTLWDPASGKELRTILPDAVSDFAWSPAGGAMAIQSGDALVLWAEESAASAHSTLPVLPAIVATGTPAAEAAQSPGPSATPRPVCGSWSIVPAPQVNAKSSELLSIAVAASNDVWAVGYTGDNPNERDSRTGMPLDTRALIVRWDGTAWTQVPAPDLGPGHSSLAAVEVISPNDVWAVGRHGATEDSQSALILHWDGTAWSRVPAPDLSKASTTGLSSLSAVSGTAPDDAWAVGTLGNEFTLILHWDGTTWTQVPSPNPGVDINQLTTVHALAKDSVWAAGQYAYQLRQMGGDQRTPFALRWDGTRWKSAPLPFEGSYVSAIDLSSDKDGWIVGGYGGEGGGRTGTSRWDGSGWRQIDMPELGEMRENGYTDLENSEFRGVVALAPNDAWAVGSYSRSGMRSPNNEYTGSTLVEHWDGTTWGQVPSPNTTHPYNTLNDVAASGAGDIWAVGYGGWYADPAAMIIMRYTGPWCPTATPTPGADHTAAPATSPTHATPQATPIPPTPQATSTAGPPDDGTASPTTGKASSVEAANCDATWEIVEHQDIGAL